MSVDRDAGEARGHFDRRSFLQGSGGMAAGLAVTIAPATAAALILPGAASAKDAQRVHPEGDVPNETVMAYVHDADKGDVTVLFGTEERTYRDPALAKRLLDAARAHKA